MIKTYDAITVKHLTIVDNADRVRVMITCSEEDGRPFVQLLDSAGHVRLELALDVDGTPGITLSSAKGLQEGSFGLNASEGAAGMTLWSENSRFFKTFGAGNDGVLDTQGEAVFDNSPDP